MSSIPTTPRLNIKAVTGTHTTSFGDDQWKKSIDQTLNDMQIIFGNSSITAEGYLTLPGGLIIQWGKSTPFPTGANNSSVVVTFPIPFPTTLFALVGCPDNFADNTGNFPITTNPSAQSLTGFTANAQAAIIIGGGGAANILNVIHYQWIAVGN